MSKTTLLASAATIKDETSPRANTATRVGTMFEDIINEAVPYKIYKALLTQTGTNAPTAVVLENTLGGTPVWSYSSTGYYILTLSGVFTLGKTLILSNPELSTDYYVLVDNPSNDTVAIFTGDLTNIGFGINGVMSGKHPITIEVYE